MKVVKTRTREEIAALRQVRFLEAWPIHAQLEAQADQINGRPEKWQRMQEDFAAIKRSLPYPV